MESTHHVWIEKYRPDTFDDIKGQDSIVEKVQAFVEQQNIPHLLFAGPAGVGKSSLALVTARQLFGEGWRQNCIELNASDERGIDVIRNKIKDFARTKALGNVPFKIIFLDECDSLTREAQQALRRTMENYTHSTRFVLSCNYLSKILDPIQSRCVVFKFKPLTREHLITIINGIATKEELTIDDEAKEALCEISNGDCRRLENILQSCAAVNKTITPDLVFSLAAVARPHEIKEVLELAVHQKFISARKKLLDVMLQYGLSGIDVIKQVQKSVWDLNITDRTKVKIIDRIGEVEFRLVEGSDEFIQLESFLAHLGTLNELQ
ncbi:replication factor C small subunit [Candidatus Woesearchaeota archaeon]|nr:replication factor C small subunit [Candidatus Woesearchaeota archaeon]